MNAERLITKSLDEILRCAREADTAIRNIDPAAPPVIEQRMRELLKAGEIEAAEDFFNSAAAELRAAINHGTAETRKKLQTLIKACLGKDSNAQP